MSNMRLLIVCFSILCILAASVPAAEPPSTPSTKAIHAARKGLQPWHATEVAHAAAILEDAMIPDLEPLHAPQLSRMSVPQTRLQDDDPDLPSCPLAIASTLAEASLLVLGLVGLGGINANRVARAIAKELGVAKLMDYKVLIQAFAQAQGTEAKSQVLYELLKKLYFEGGLYAALAAVTQGMSWWEWLYVSGMAALQFFTWFVTDDMAMVAQLLVLVVNAFALKAAASDALQACGYDVVSVQ